MRASPRRAVLALTSAAGLALATGQAFALPQDPDRQRAAVPGPTPLEQAREEAGVKDLPRTRYKLPAGELRLSRSELLATARMELELSVTLARDVGAGTLSITLPARWTGRSGVSRLPFARVPATGRGSARRARAAREARVVRLAFDGGRAGDVARFELRDSGIPGGTYRLRYRWRDDAGGSARGVVTVVVYNPARESADDETPGWDVFMRDTNATNDGATESETFLTVVPGNSQRYVVGANGGGSYSGWITNNGGASFTKAPMNASIDAPGEAVPETSDLCCDPISAADAAGNIWYGGLSDYTNSASPSRVIVARSAPGSSSFGTTVGLPVRFATTGVQDKPMMTIDNSPASPAFGRLYVVWDEPGAGVDIVMSQCNTRPGGVANPANCDNADNWTAPVPVTPAEGSYIYADVATGPDGKVYVVWWDYSSANAIRGDVCNPASQNCAAASGWGTPETIATLDRTNNTALPFACPIVAQPGGRASTSPQVDVDRSGGPNDNRVYVTWSDLRPGSGTTKCNTTPALTHLTFDSFVASAVGTLPGSANPSATVATRLLADGEAGGQANSDDWFAWLAVDQTDGQAWADFYSTRDDPTRKTTNFYVRSVTPSGAAHTLGSLRRVSTAPSDYSASACCSFGNDYGDYTGIDATSGVPVATWSDRRAPPSDGEAFVAFLSSYLDPGAFSVDDSPAAGGGGDGDQQLEPGESFRITQALRNDGVATATAVTATLSAPAETGVTLTQASSSYPDIVAGATQVNSSPFAGRLDASAPCGTPVTMNLQVTSAARVTFIPVRVPTAASCSTPPPPVAPPPVAPPPVAPPPVAPPPVAPPPPLDSTITFALSGSSSQRPLIRNRGLRISLSCPLEDCRTTVSARLTLPSARSGGRATTIRLRSQSAALTSGRPTTLTFKLSKRQRDRVARALRSSRTRNRVRVVFSARATDAAGNASTKTLSVKVRR